jgi:hypothetical protein
MDRLKKAAKDAGPWYALQLLLLIALFQYAGVSPVSF